MSDVAASSLRPPMILGKGVYHDEDTWKTGLNNNLLVLGPTGSGKTRYVLKPNLLQMEGSYIVLDTKGLLFDEVGPIMADHGYKVQQLDFADIGGNIGYNPLAHVRRGADGRPNQQDILSMAKALCPIENRHDPFWDNAAANYLASYIAYVLEEMPEGHRTLDEVCMLLDGMSDETTADLIDRLEQKDPDSFAVALYRRAEVTSKADRMHASILGILAEKVMCLAFDTAIAMYRKEPQVDFARMGHEKVVLFATVSDVDHSLEPLTDLFVRQAFTALIEEADRNCEDGRLLVPVRLMLDDFANLRIDHFVDDIAVIRSREIYATIICQTLTQLQAKYGHENAAVIAGNCSNQLILGFQDPETANYYAPLAGRPPRTLLATPRDKAWLFTTGNEPRMIRKYVLIEHPNYRDPKEFDWEALREKEGGSLLEE